MLRATATCTRCSTWLSLRACGKANCLRCIGRTCISPKATCASFIRLVSVGVKNPCWVNLRQSRQGDVSICPGKLLRFSGHIGQRKKESRTPTGWYSPAITAASFGKVTSGDASGAIVEEGKTAAYNVSQSAARRQLDTRTARCASESIARTVGTRDEQDHVRCVHAFSAFRHIGRGSYDGHATRRGWAK